MCNLHSIRILEMQSQRTELALIQLHIKKMNDGSKWWLHIRTMLHCTPDAFCLQHDIFRSLHLAINEKLLAHFLIFNNSMFLLILYTWLSFSRPVVTFHLALCRWTEYFHSNCMEIILFKTMNNFNIKCNEWESQKKYTTYNKTWFRDETQ